MFEKSKHLEIRNFVAYDIINERLKDGDKLYTKEFFIAKFRINPSYLDRAYEQMINEGIIEARSDYYYMIVNDQIKLRLKNEFANALVNEYLAKMRKIGFDANGSFNFMIKRMNANG